MGKQGKTPKNSSYSQKNIKRGKQSNEKETKTIILLLELAITKEKSSRKKKRTKKKNKLLEF